MKDPRKPTHGRIRVSLELLEPVVHDPALPSVVHGIRSCDSSMKEPLGRAAVAAEWHLDDGVDGNGGAARWAGEVLAERSIAGDDDVVGYESH